MEWRRFVTYLSNDHLSYSALINKMLLNVVVCTKVFKGSCVTDGRMTCVVSACTMLSLLL